MPPVHSQKCRLPVKQVGALEVQLAQLNIPALPGDNTLYLVFARVKKMLSGSRLAVGLAFRVRLIQRLLDFLGIIKMQGKR